MKSRKNSRNDSYQLSLKDFGMYLNIAPMPSFKDSRQENVVYDDLRIR
jgi:hypothetical protein